MTKLAIIGASYLQLPLIEKAKSMGIETHVFAWAANDVGESAADHFYPISIVEKEQILVQCRQIGIDGICSIASDLAMVTVNYVAEEMGLTGNSMRCTMKSTNKHLMRRAFEENHDPSPKSLLVESASDLKNTPLHYPIIVKPTDRSGSRGITKLRDESGLEAAIETAKAQSFEKKALVEEFAEGQEYSVECISWNGQHNFLALTKKFTTGAPHFIETGHLQPAPVSDDILLQVQRVVFHALDSLEIRNGASHSELKISDDGTIRLIEIGGRMGGDFIGSKLVELSTGIDFVRAVIQIALNQEPDLRAMEKQSAAAVHFVFDDADISVLRRLKEYNPEYLISESIDEVGTREVVDSSTRFGYYLMRAELAQQLMRYLPCLDENL